MVQKLGPPRETTLLDRFAERLSSALDAKGYPRPHESRAQALANDLGIEQEVTSDWLRGLSVPSWPLFEKTCLLLEHEPGHFLDWMPREFPGDTELVRPLVSGEALVLRMPPERAGKTSFKGLVKKYVVASRHLGFGLRAGDLIVMGDMIEGGNAPLAAEELYLLVMGGRYFVVRCAHLTAGSAWLESDGTSSPGFALKLDRYGRVKRATLSRDGVLAFGPVIAVVRSADVLTGMGSDLQPQPEKEKPLPPKGAALNHVRTVSPSRRTGETPPKLPQLRVVAPSTPSDFDQSV